MRKKPTLIILVSVFIVWILWASPASAQGQRQICQEKATQTMANLDKWIHDYKKQQESADPLQKPKYDEWIQELEKLRALIEAAQEKLQDEKQCAGEECVSDQCSLIDIADQQAAEIVQESEEQIGATVQFGGKTGREVIVDDEQIGDDTIIDTEDHEDAQQHQYSDKSEESGDKSMGILGDVFEQPAPDEKLPPEDPKNEVSLQ